MTDDSSRGWIMDYPIYEITWTVLEFLSANDQLWFIISIEIGQISHLLVVNSQKFEILLKIWIRKIIFVSEKVQFSMKKSQNLFNKESMIYLCFHIFITNLFLYKHEFQQLMHPIT